MQLLALAIAAVAVVLAAPVRGGTYWNELPLAGAAMAPRSLPAAAYCAELDAMVIMFGAALNESGTLHRDAFVYDFATQELLPVATSVSPLESRWGRVRSLFGANLVSVDPHPDLPGSCRFLLYGGSTSVVSNLRAPQRFEVGLVDAVWTIDLTLQAGNATLTATTVTVWGEYEPWSSFGGNAVAGAATCAPFGRWENVLDIWMFGPSSHASSVLLDNGDTLAMYGGQGVKVIPPGYWTRVYGSKFTTFNLTELAVTSRRMYYRSVAKGIGQDTQYEYVRVGHGCAALGNTMFVFGGLMRSSERDDMLLAKNNFLSITTLHTQEGSLRCTTGDGKAVAWCGFQEEHPGEFSMPVVLTRGDMLVALVVAERSGTTRNELWELNMTRVLQTGTTFFVDAQALAPQELSPSRGVVFLICLAVSGFCALIAFVLRDYKLRSRSDEALKLLRGLARGVWTRGIFKL